MCHARPVKVIGVCDREKTIRYLDSDGIEQQAGTALLGDALVFLGDHVEVRGGFVTRLFTQAEIAAIRHIHVGSDVPV